MKIAIFSESFTPYVSGVSRSVEVLYKELNKLGHDVYVFSSKYPGHVDTDDKIIRFPSFPSGYPKFRIAVPYWKKIPNIDFDIIHSHSPFQLGLMSQRLAKKKNIPFVYSFHTLFTEYLHYSKIPRFISKPLFSKYLKNFCSRCNAIIAPGEKAKEYINNFAAQSLIEIIPSGIDVDDVLNSRSIDIKREYNIPSNAKILIYVGRLSKEKNIPFIFKAFELVVQKYPNAFLLMVAGGPFEKKLKKLAKMLGISKNTIFVGQIPHEKVFEYYKCANIFVFASKTETQGLVIAEAKACGLPVVAVNASGISEGIIDQVDGFLTSDDILSFSEKILFLLNNDSIRGKMGKNAVENSLKLFSSKTIAKRIESVYNALIEEKLNN